jgi:DNA-binding SARP family transcriptional activator
VEQGQLVVDVLGPVQIVGAATSFHRPAARELVVYLALHREGARYEQWSEALWPHRSVTAATLYSTASDARRALGTDRAGSLWLPRGSRLRLSDSVVTDVGRFVTLAAAEEPDQLQRALDLVRGPLLGGLARTDWAVLDGTLASLEAMVAGAALSATRAFLTGGCAEEAVRAARQGLIASPYDERLYRALLEATAAQGNRVGLRRAMAELLARAARGDPPRAPEGAPAPASPQLSLLHPETTALYRQLAGRLPATGGLPVRL